MGYLKIEKSFIGYGSSRRVAGINLVFSKPTGKKWEIEKLKRIQITYKIGKINWLIKNGYWK